MRQGDLECPLLFATQSFSDLVIQIASAASWELHKSIMVVKRMLTLFGAIKPGIDCTSDLVPMFRCGHIVVAHSLEYMIGDQLSGPPSIGADKIYGYVVRILTVGHCPQSDCGARGSLMVAVDRQRLLAFTLLACQPVHVRDGSVARL